MSTNRQKAHKIACLSLVLALALSNCDDQILPLDGDAIQDSGGDLGGSFLDGLDRDGVGSDGADSSPVDAPTPDQPMLDSSSHDEGLGSDGDGFAMDGVGTDSTGSDSAGLDGTASDSAASDSAGSDAIAPDSGLASPAFTVAMLPDTQYYTWTTAWMKHFTAQTDWIVKNKTAQQIVFVTHVGDIVDSGAALPFQWTRADQAMKILDGDLKKNPDGVIPYSAVVGNHDYDIIYIKAAATQYIKYFGPSRYSGRSWFLGASSNKTCMAQRFNAMGKTYLHLGLEWNASDACLLWAQGLLAKNPQEPVIISTHEYLDKGNPGHREKDGGKNDSGGDNCAEHVYRKMVEPFPQVFLVLSGHISGDGRLASKGALGLTTMQMLADYQTDPNGGNGWMQLIRFDPAQKSVKSVSFKAFSPTYKAGSTSGTDRTKSSQSNHSFSFDLDGHRSYLQSNKVLHFRQGQDFGAGAYSGTEDTYIGSGKTGFTKPGSSYGSQVNVLSDQNLDQEQGLIRFGNIVGTSKGQIPPKTPIKKAILTFTTEGLFSNSNNGSRFYPMTATWSETSTWNSLVGGIQVGVETDSKYAADSKSLVSDKGTRSMDVSTSVQAWVDGKPNYGWAVIANGTDRWQFRSSEWGTIAERPMLTVVY